MTELNVAQLRKQHDKETPEKAADVQIIAASILDNVIEKVNSSNNRVNSSNSSDHKSLVLSVMKRAMRDASIGNKEKCALNNHQILGETAASSSVGFHHSKHQKSVKSSPKKPMVRNNSAIAPTKVVASHPCNRKIITAIVGEMVKSASSSKEKEDGEGKQSVAFGTTEKTDADTRIPWGKKKV